MDVIDYLQKQGYKTINSEYYAAIDGWDSWYRGNVKDFHHYKVYNGKKFVKKYRKTLAMPKKVSEDFANLLLNEKVKITLDDDKSQEFVDNVLDRNNFMVKGNEAQELKAALGTVAYLPYVTGSTEANGIISGGNIDINYVPGNRVYPLSWRNGKVIDCAFGADITHQDKTYIHLQIHTLKPEGYLIENKMFETTNGKFMLVNLNAVPGYENVARSIQTSFTERQFVIDRPNIANNYDKLSPMGVSLFANSIDVMRGLDLAYDSYCNEFETGRKRVFVRPEMLSMDDDGVVGFDTNETTFYMLPDDDSGDKKTFLQEVNMELRTTAHNEAIAESLQLLSAKIGFGKDYYQIYQNNNITTATQVMSENSTMFRTIKKHEIILEDVIKELIHIILRLGKEVIHVQGINTDPEITIDFDDSIIEDKQAEFNRDIVLVNAGAMGVDELRAKYMNESLEDARKNLPGGTEEPPDDSVE